MMTKTTKRQCNCNGARGGVTVIVTIYPPIALVLWDAIPDVDDFEIEESLLLDPTKWQKKGKCGWIKDTDVEFYDNYYDENDSVVEAGNKSRQR